VNLTDHAAKLVARTRAAGGLAPVDLARFWSDQDRAFANPFGIDIPQVPLGVLMSRECVFAELEIPETPANWHRLLHDAAWAAQVSRAYNDKAEQIVGRRLLSETSPDPERTYPPVKQLHDIFEATNIWHNESYWLQQSAHGETELQQLLDRVEQRLENLRAFLLPENWDSEKARLTKLGVSVPTYRFQRGPVTFATSIYGAEDFVFLILDNPDLAVRFRDVMIRAMLEIARILDDEAGQSPRGFQFNDDNCCLLTAEMYELFAYPILKTMFDRSASAPGDRRYQHSDSAMGHLLPVLARLNFTGVNFGPTLPVALIREHMPSTIIDGQLAPFTFSRNEEENIVREFLRDFEQARAQRGLCFSTAGSINNGSRLTGMRLIMAAIQEYGRYA
jgi:uroporphyrinogen decarboxylase